VSLDAWARQLTVPGPSLRIRLLYVNDDIRRHERILRLSGADEGVTAVNRPTTGAAPGVEHLADPAIGHGEGP
jgi:hypothetical protein